jgi:hypothetical protein
MAAMALRYEDNVAIVNIAQLPYPLVKRKTAMC